MEIRRYVTTRPSPVAVLAPTPRIRVTPVVRPADALALTSKSKAPEGRTTTLTQLEDATLTFRLRLAGGTALTLGGLAMMIVGALAFTTLPGLAFTGLFAGGIAVIGSGLAVAWRGAKGLADAQAALDHTGMT